MKFPKEVWVRDSVYRIEFKRKLGEPRLFGYCDPSDKLIVIRAGLPLHEQIDTFCHECTHAIEEEYSFEVPHKLVNKLSGAWTRLLIDNFF